MQLATAVIAISPGDSDFLKFLFEELLEFSEEFGEVRWIFKIKV
jgi:hypothetical protein